MKKNYIFYVLSSFIFSSCNYVSLYKPRNKKARNYLTEAILKSTLNEFKPYILKNAKIGESANSFIAVKDQDNSDIFGDYDSLLWAGLLCLSGVKEQCTAVKNSQDDDGKFWRSPRRINVKNQNFTFSRDMGLGVLAYLIATQDRQTAMNWQVWLVKNNWQLCSEPANQENTQNILGFQMADDRCTLYAHNLAIYREVWNYLNLPLPAKLKNQNYESIACNFLGVLSVLDQSGKVFPNNFNLHLLATEFLLRIKLYRQKALQQMGSFDITKLGFCGQHVAQGFDLSNLLKGFVQSPLSYFTHFLVKKQGKNPLFLLLDQQYTQSMLEALNTIKLKKEVYSDLVANPRLQWSFEREEGTFAFQQTMFWEYLFYLNLINDPLLTL